MILRKSRTVPNAGTISRHPGARWVSDAASVVDLQGLIGERNNDLITGLLAFPEKATTKGAARPKIK